MCKSWNFFLVYFHSLCYINIINLICQLSLMQLLYNNFCFSLFLCKLIFNSHMHNHLHKFYKKILDVLLHKSIESQILKIFQLICHVLVLNHTKKTEQFTLKLPHCCPGLDKGMFLPRRMCQKSRNSTILCRTRTDKFQATLVQMSFQVLCCSKAFSTLFTNKLLLLSLIHIQMCIRDSVIAIHSVQI